MSNMLLLYERGQSTWLDYAHRDLLDGGGLRQLIDNGLRGVCSSAGALGRYLRQSDTYDDTVRDLIQADYAIDSPTIYEWLSIADTKKTADIFQPAFVASRHRDGYVCIAPSPYLSNDTQSIIRTARHLWKAVDRPNVMISIPATAEALPAIERLIAEGININTRLLFSLSRYNDVLEAYVRGLAMCETPETVASVASFSVSPIDAVVDPLLDAITTPQAQALKRRVAVAIAKLAYQCYRAFFADERFNELREKGAQTQRLLWANTTPANETYPDLYYLNALVGPETVVAIAPHMVDAFEAHGDVTPRLAVAAETARRDLDALASLAINLDGIAAELETQGLRRLQQGYDDAMAALAEKQAVVTQDFATH